MAYQFPPRGFASPVNNPQFPPHFCRPPHPPPAQSFQTPTPPPGGYCAGLERPPFHGGAPGSFPHGSSSPRGVTVRPGNRACAWMGDGIAGSGPPLGQFPPRPAVPCSQRPILPGPRCGWFPHRPPNFGGDVKHCEPWPELAERGRQGPRTPGDGQHSHKENHGTSSLRKAGPSTKKKRNRRPSKNRQGAEAPPSENQNSNCTNSESTPQPSSSQSEHYCDVCDRGFKSAALLDEHLTQHTKCKHPGCKFEAHFKIVKNHTKLQHGPGSKRVPWLDSPGEIAKWREERKRNYPSVENIARKAAAKKSNEEKGAVLQNKYFGKMRQPKRWRQRHRGAMGDDGIAAKRARVDTARTNGHMKVEDTVSNSGSHGKGAASSSPPHHQAEVTSKGNLGSLSALVAAYDDSSEEEGEIVEDSPATEECSNQDKPTSRHGENGQTSLDKSQDQSSASDGRSRGRLSSWRGQGTDRRKPRQRTRRNKKGQEGRLERERQARLRRRPNLLEMLLAPEIRRERNVILQCVRHIVRNDFFGVNQARKPEGHAAEQKSERRPPSGVEEAPTQEAAGMEVAKMNGHHSETDVRTEDKKTQRAKEEPLENAATCQGPETDVGSHGENMGGIHWQLHERWKVEDADATGAKFSSKEEGSNEEMDMKRATEVCNSTYEQDGCKSVEDSCDIDGNMDGVNESGSSTKELGEPRSLETGPKVGTPNTNQLNDGFRKREGPEMTVITARVSADECGLPASAN